MTAKLPFVILVALLVGAISPVSSPAQTFTEKGVVLGLTSTTFHANLADDEIAFNDVISRKTGRTLGGFVVMPLAGSLSLQPEFLYSQKGATMNFVEEEDEIFGDVEINAEMELTYLEVPVLLRYTIPTTGLLRPHLLAGPSAGLNLSSKVNVDAFGFSASEDIKEEVSNFELGLVLGGAVDYGFDFGRLSVGARYVLGLSDVIDGSNETDELADLEGSETLQNRALTLMVGFSF